MSKIQDGRHLCKVKTIISFNFRQKRVSRLGVCRWFSRYTRLYCVAREKFKHIIVGKIQDGRHLTR